MAADLAKGDTPPSSPALPRQALAQSSQVDWSRPCTLSLVQFRPAARPLAERMHTLPPSPAHPWVWGGQLTMTRHVRRARGRDMGPSQEDSGTKRNLYAGPRQGY